MEKKESVKSPAKQWYNPQFFKLKLLLLCLGLCFIAFVLWVENLTPDLTSLPGVWKSETGQIMAVSGKRNSVSDMNYTLYDGSLVFDGQTFAKQEEAVFTKLDNSDLFVEFGDAQFIMKSDSELFYRGMTFYKDRFYYQNHYHFGKVVAPVGEPIHFGRVLDMMMQFMYGSFAVLVIYLLLQSMFPLFSVSVLIPRIIRQKWGSWCKNKEEKKQRATKQVKQDILRGNVRLFLQRLYGIAAKIWYFFIGCFMVLIIIGGIFGVAGSFIPGLIVDSDDLPGLWKTKDGTVLAISTIHDTRGRGTTQYDWEVVRDGEILLDWGDVYSDESKDGYEAVIVLGNGKTPDYVFYMEGADQMIFDEETYHKIDTEETSYNFGNMAARVGFDDQTGPQISPWIFLTAIIIFTIWVVYEFRKETATLKKANRDRMTKKGKIRGK